MIKELGGKWKGTVGPAHVVIQLQVHASCLILDGIEAALIQFTDGLRLLLMEGSVLTFQ